MESEQRDFTMIVLTKNHFNERIHKCFAEDFSIKTKEVIILGFRRICFLSSLERIVPNLRNLGVT